MVHFSLCGFTQFCPFEQLTKEKENYLNLSLSKSRSINWWFFHVGLALLKSLCLLISLEEFHVLPFFQFFFIHSLLLMLVLNYQAINFIILNQSLTYLYLLLLIIIILELTSQNHFLYNMMVLTNSIFVQFIKWSNKMKKFHYKSTTCVTFLLCNCMELQWKMFKWSIWH